MEETKETKRRLWAEIAGWYGTVAIVLAYVLVSFGVIPAGGGTTKYLT